MRRPSRLFHSRFAACVLFISRLAFFSVVAGATPGGSQTVVINSWPNGSVDLTPEVSQALPQSLIHSKATSWRSHDGDDPSYALTSFDDSAWPASPPSFPFAISPAPLGNQPNPGWHWYRLHVQIPASHPPLALLISGGEGTYEIYLNGEQLPGPALTGEWSITSPRLRSIPIPARSGDLAGDLVIAMRTYVPPSAFFAGDRGAWRVTLGTQPTINSMLEADLGQRLARIEPSIFINLLIVLAGLIVLALFAARREHREYLWLGISLILVSSSYAMWTLVFTCFLPIAADAPGNSIFYLSLAFQVEFAFAFVGRKVNRGWRLYQLLLILAAVGMYWIIGGSLTLFAFNAEQVLLALPSAFLLPMQLFFWYRRGNREAGWLIFPMLISSLILALYDFGGAAASLGWIPPVDITQILQIGPVPVQQWDLANLLFVPAIGAVIFLRFTRLSREQDRTAGELTAARELQQRLVPATLPSTPGYSIGTAYVPAAEVGGDFYQIIPRPNDATLIVLGDVSGKGLKAAMTGTLAIGALRTLAAEDHSPAAMMTRLNQQMVESGNDGFITCLILRIDRDGYVSVANAGHIPPYRNGLEVQFDPGLPLGITLDSEYAETALQLYPGDQLTLITDGVLEATSPSGELFGFERTAAISTQTAERIAQTAQRFGQDDDITVLTLQYAPAEETYV